MKDSHPLLQNRIRYFLITAFFIVFTVVAVVFFLTQVRIQTVTVENRVYSGEAEVLDAANIKKGTHSYAIDKDKIAEAIIAKNPYVTDVRIKRTSISSISIILTEDAPRFYIERGGKYVILSETLRVLAEYENLADCAHLSVYPIKLMPIESAELGKTLVFAEGYEENGKECISLLSQISDSELSGTITYADVSVRFDLRFTYKDKYEILFGAPKNFAKKLDMVIETIEFLENPENNYSAAKGIIRASVNGETTFDPTGAVETPESGENAENNENTPNNAEN
ncbi:MAG: FtsQ-type POTRA domain-containing protein [Clostridia bacterium]|nr:FtsQ-type POTRA domain-containing protein [Clostridia bacterium]